MHMNDHIAACGFMQPVHILRDQQQVISKCAPQLGQGCMCCIWLDRRRTFATTAALCLLLTSPGAAVVAKQGAAAFAKLGAAFCEAMGEGRGRQEVTKRGAVALGWRSGHMCACAELSLGWP